MGYDHAAAMRLLDEMISRRPILVEQADDANDGWYTHVFRAPRKEFESSDME
jgi:hypothetical protein